MLRPWDFNVDIVRDSETPIHAQIAGKIIEEIQLGRFVPGMALPGTRKFSNRLKINRKTVIQAYDELIAQGWLTAESKRGTFVSPHVLAVSQHMANIKGLQNNSFARKHPLPENLPGRNPKKKLADNINFAEDAPDSRLVPFAALSRSIRHALISSLRNAKPHHSDPRGTKILREAVLHMLNMEKGLHAELDNVCIVRGSQMGVFLAARALIGAGDSVVVEHLSNPVARETFRNCGANLLTVPHNSEGVDLPALEKLCINHKVKAIYVNPHHQIPTTACMSPENKKGLLRLAGRYEFFIIEDDNDSEFNYSGKPLFPIASQDRQGWVIYIGSLSKVLAPGFRIGYAIAPGHLVEHFARDITIIDRHGNTAIELAIAELLLTGEIKRHLMRAIQIYNERRVHACQLIDVELESMAGSLPPETGLSLWLKFAPHINTHRLVQDAEKDKLILHDPGIYALNSTAPQGLRLAFASQTREELSQGIKAIRNACLEQYHHALRA